MVIQRWLVVVWGAILLAGVTWAGELSEMPPAQEVDGVTLLPLRYIAEWFGATVHYQQTDGAIRIEVHEHVVQLTPGQSIGHIDGRAVSLLVPAQVREDRTYVPVRFLAEALGARVDPHYGTEMQLQAISIRVPSSGEVLLVRVAPAQSPAPLTASGQALFTAVDRNDTATLTRLLDTEPALTHARDAQGNTPLLRAIARGSQPVARLLLNRQPEINAENQAGQTALHLAAAAGLHDLVALLIGQRARFSRTDALGQTALHLAARSGHLATARTLLDFGAPVDARDLCGQTPLLVAVRANQAEMTTLLLDAGASAAAHDIDWYTPLHCAAAAGATAMVTALLQHGALASARAKGGKTPLDLAKECGHPAIVALLQ